MSVKQTYIDVDRDFANRMRQQNIIMQWDLGYRCVNCKQIEKLVQNVKNILAIITRDMDYYSGELLIWLFRTLLTFHLVYFVLIWPLYLRKDEFVLEALHVKVPRNFFRELWNFAFFFPRKHRMKCFWIYSRWRLTDI